MVDLEQTNISWECFQLENLQIKVFRGFQVFEYAL